MKTNVSKNNRLPVFFLKYSKNNPRAIFFIELPKSNKYNLKFEKVTVFLNQLLFFTTNYNWNIKRIKIIGSSF